MEAIDDDPESIITNSTLSHEDALKLFLSIDDFTFNTESNKKLYHSIQQNKGYLPPQPIRTYSVDWYRSMCILHHFLSIPKERQHAMKQSAVFKDRSKTRGWKINGEHFNKEEMKRSIIATVPNGQEIEARIIQEIAASQASSTAATITNTAPNQHNEGQQEAGSIEEVTESNREINEWNTERSCLLMLLALSIDECRNDKNFQTFHQLLPKRGHKPGPKVMYSNDDPT